MQMADSMIRPQNLSGLSLHPQSIPVHDIKGTVSLDFRLHFGSKIFYGKARNFLVRVVNDYTDTDLSLYRRYPASPFSNIKMIQ